MNDKQSPLPLLFVSSFSMIVGINPRPSLLTQIDAFTITGRLYGNFFSVYGAQLGKLAWDSMTETLYAAVWGVPNNERPSIIVIAPELGGEVFWMEVPFKNLGAVGAIAVSSSLRLLCISLLDSNSIILFSLGTSPQRQVPILVGTFHSGYQNLFGIVGLAFWEAQNSVLITSFFSREVSSMSLSQHKDAYTVLKIDGFPQDLVVLTSSSC